MNGFEPPAVEIGDTVLYYDNPLNQKDPTLGWVSRRPGVNTLYVLVFSPDSGFIEKPSVRHGDDPGLQENAAWRQWGCWRMHPNTATLKRLDSLLPQITALLARGQEGSKKRG
jgi:hypothetical protein